MSRTGTTAGMALALLLVAGGARAEPPALGLPVDCAMGSACFVQQYVDHDAGPGAVDYTCGPLSYDGHDGTDIRAATITLMEAGVPVLAAAPGVVVGTRNSMPDIEVGATGAEALAGREAGNGVRIDHGGGWFTQYSHLREGSVRVAVGDRVEAGQPLGLIGMSGLAQFPHVEFSVEHDGADVDPFVGEDAAWACGGERRPLWTAAASEALAYVPGAALSAGFATEAADFDTARSGGYDDVRPGPGMPALVVWAEFFGVRADDRIRMVLDIPGDAADIEHTEGVERDRAREFRFAGRRVPEGGWPAGTYVGSAELIRRIDGDDRIVSRIERSFVLP